MAITAGWDKGGSRLQPFKYLTNGFESACISFSPDGKILVAAGLSFAPDAPKEPSGATNRLAFWEVGSWKKLDLLPQAGAGVTEWAAANTVDLSSAWFLDPESLGSPLVHGSWISKGDRPDLSVRASNSLIFTEDD